MKHNPLAAALVAGMIALPLIVVSVPVSAQPPDYGAITRSHSPHGQFSVKPVERKPVIDLLSARHYRVCNDATSHDELTVHYGEARMSLLQPGECHDFETAKLEVESLSKEGMAPLHGTFHHLGPPHPRP